MAGRGSTLEKEIGSLEEAECYIHSGNKRHRNSKTQRKYYTDPARSH